jgi:hypothetical protein
VLLQGFFREFLPVGVVFVSTGIDDISASFGQARVRLVPFAFGAPQEV